MDHPEFSSDPLPPFGTLEERQRLILKFLKEEPMLLICWVHRACPALDLALMFAGHEYLVGDNYDEFMAFWIGQRRSLRSRCVSTLNFIFEGMLNVDPTHARAMMHFNKHRKWVSW